MAEFRLRKERVTSSRWRPCELQTTSVWVLVGCLMVAFLAQMGKCVEASAADRVYLESFALKGVLSFENTSAVEKDWGQLRRGLAPAAVVYPTAVEDVATVVAAVARADSGLTVAARGLGHSISGQAQAHNGVVIEMTAMRGIRVMPLGDAASHGVPFVEARGGDVWVDVLTASLKFGMAPKSWTDYLHLTIGGTLSNAGVSGQAFRHGPEISNVLQLQVVTGKGDLLDCSPTLHPELFFAVLGGLGQFGIITKARIVLERAPQRVRWLRALYTDFASFKRDQEFLIGSATPFDYVEGFVVANNANPINGWASVAFANEIITEAMIPAHAGPVLYCLEVTKAYSAADVPNLDQYM